MVGLTDIQQIYEKIQREFKPDKIVLFGSYAWGTPRDDSDVDLLVILPYQGKAWRMASSIREQVQSCFPLDILVRNTEQIQARLAINDSFLTDIMTRGKVVYEA
jgi:predicted nucleotidyltransferase